MKDVQQALDRLVPEPARMSAWEEVLRDARPRTRSLGMQLAVVTGIAALAALFVVAPWQGSERVGILDRALAAVGDKPVLHVVLESPRAGDQLVDLESGRPVVTMGMTEVWFDQARSLKKTATRIDGVLMDEMLETPKGGFTQGGVIYTCRWIEEHPVEAAKARVSCPGGEPSSEAQPSLDPALANFVDHYQTALASGNARRISGNQVDGHDVIWIEFGIGRTLERVALDKSTYTPVLISTPYGSQRVRTVETVPFEQRLFSRPKPDERPAPAGGSVIAEQELGSMSAANPIFGGRVLWLGPAWRGLRLTSVKRQVLGMSYGPRSEREPSRTVGVELSYSTGADGPTAIQVMETLSCQMAYAWTCQALDPGEGMALLRGPMTLVRRGGLFITILARQIDRSAALEIARSLRAVSEP